MPHQGKRTSHLLTKRQEGRDHRIRELLIGMWLQSFSNSLHRDFKIHGFLQLRWDDEYRMSWSNSYPSTCTSTGDCSLQRPQKADEQWGMLPLLYRYIDSSCQLLRNNAGKTVALTNDCRMTSVMLVHKYNRSYRLLSPTNIRQTIA